MSSPRNTKKLEVRFDIKLLELKLPEASSALFQVVWGKGHDKGESRKVLASGDIATFSHTVEIKATLKGNSEGKYKSHPLPLQAKAEEGRGKKKPKTSVVGKTVLDLAPLAAHDSQVSDLSLQLGKALLTVRVTSFWLSVDGVAYKKSPRGAAISLPSSKKKTGASALFRKISPRPSAAPVALLGDSSSSSEEEKRPEEKQPEARAEKKEAEEVEEKSKPVEVENPLAAKNAELRAALDSARTELEALKTKLAQAEQAEVAVSEHPSYKQLERQYETSASDASNLRLQLIELERRLKSSEALKDGHQSEGEEAVQMLEMQLAAVEQDMDDYKAEVDELTEEKEQLQEKLKAVESSEGNLRVRLTKAQKEMKALQLEYMKEKERNKVGHRRKNERKEEAQAKGVLDSVYAENTSLQESLQVAEAVQGAVYEVTHAYEPMADGDLRPEACSKVVAQLTLSLGDEAFEKRMRDAVLEALGTCAEAQSVDRSSRIFFLSMLAHSIHQMCDVHASPASTGVLVLGSDSDHWEESAPGVADTLRRLEPLMISAYRRLAEGVWKELEPLVLPCILERTPEAFQPEQEAIHDRDQTGAEQLLFRLQDVLAQCAPLFPKMRVQLFTLLMHRISAHVFNAWVVRRDEFDTASHAFQIKLEISKLRDFELQQALAPLDLLRDAANLLIVPKAAFADGKEAFREMCPSLNPRQIAALLGSFRPDEIEPSVVTAELLAQVRRDAEECSDPLEVDQDKLM